MSYTTKRVKNLSLNYDKNKIEPIEDKGIYQLPSSHTIEEITLLANSNKNNFVEPVTTYLIHRHLTGKENSSFEAKGLRLYFDFLEVINKSWLDGSDETFNRPISLFSKYLKSSFEKGEIAGTVAIGYFNIISRFYQFHLEKGQVFNGTPISFKTKKIEVNTNSLTNHIAKYSVEINTVDCAPNIPSTAKSSELKPLSKEHLKLLFKTLKEKSTPEFFLICFIAQTTGLRIGEIADLKLEHISKYDDEPIFNLYVGPQVGHHTKGNQNGVIKVNKTVMNIIKEHTLTSAYLKRLGRFKGDKPYLILNRKGQQYTQEVLSVMFNQFMHQHIKPIDPSFSYKFHDLRATFGVSIMKACLDSKMSRSEALAYTQNQMRHKSLETTLHYLEYWTHSAVNEQKSKMQEDLLSSVIANLGDIL
jgi:integrase